MKPGKIPVTIITGFLGSGKTTLLNYLIRKFPEKKFAIIENEFGDIPIDQELVVNAGEGIFELSNGCICCSLNAELGAVLQQLIEGDYEFNHLIIETTGIAEPDGIAAAFIGGNRSSTFRLDGTICLTDAKNIEINIEERGEALKQVLFADAIVLNKTDLVGSAQLQLIVQLLHKYNPDARIFQASFGQVEGDVLRLEAYETGKLENKLLNPQYRLRHDDLAAHSFEFGTPLIPEKFEHWINMLLFLSGYQVYRIKGILNLQGESHKIIFQSVRSNSSIEVGSPWGKGEHRTSKLVFIGSGIKKVALKKGLNGCKVRSPGD